MDTFEKKYNEALERAKAYHRNELAGSRKEMTEYIFPELRESEDERIRKKLYNTVVGTPNDSTWFDGTSKEAMLAWLEKQKEQPISAVEVLARAGLKPYKDGNQWCILAGDNLQEGICGFGDTIEDALYEFLKEVLDLQKEQKPVAWSEEDEKELDCIINVLDRLGFEEFCKSSRDQDNEEERFYYKEIQFLKRLKSLRPVKQEWSKKDEDKLYQVMETLLADKTVALRETPHCKALHEAYDEMLAWLKSIRPSWKPSEEQMKALNAVNCYGELSYQGQQQPLND